MTDPHNENITRILRGEHELFREIVHEYRDRLLTLGYRFTGNWEDAKELVQISFIRIFQALSKYDSNRPFEKWLVTIHLNVCRNEHRRQKLRRMILLPIDVANRMLVSSKPTSDLDLIQACIERLSWRQRIAFVMIEVEEQSPADVAKLFGCATATVRVHLSRAKQNLRRTLTKAGVDPDE